MNGHSSIGPSSAERWVSCPGSVALSAKCVKPKTNRAAAEGTVAHGLAEELVSGKIDDLALMTRKGQVVETDGHEITVDDEMIEAVILYRDVIASDLAAMKKEGRPALICKLTEERVHVRSISEELWGTADFILYQKGNKIKVYDFKYGYGVVEAKENKQMACYLQGAMETFAGDVFDELEQIIVQPRAPHADGVVRRWIVPQEWLATFLEEARAAVEETARPDAKLKSGDHCKWCPAQSGGCPEIFREAQMQTQADFTVYAPTETEIKAGNLGGLPDIRLMSFEKLALALGWQDAIESFFSSVKDRVREVLESGQSVPGWKLVEGRSNRKYIDEKKVIERYEPEIGERLWEKKLLSPAKLEAVVGKKKIDDLVYKPEARKAIARDTDPRPVAALSAQVDFDPMCVGAVPVPPVADPFGLPSSTAKFVEPVVTVVVASGDPFTAKKDKLWP